MTMGWRWWLRIGINPTWQHDYRPYNHPYHLRWIAECPGCQSLDIFTVWILERVKYLLRPED